MLDDADRHARQIGEPLLEQRVTDRRPEVAHLERLELEGLLRGQVILADQLGNAADEFPVLEHQHLRVENAGFVGAGAVLGAVPELQQLAADVLQRRAQAPHLFLDLCARHDTMRNFRQCPPHRRRRSDSDAGRDADAFEQPVTVRNHSSSCAGAFRCISLNPAATSSSSAAIACSASSPSVRIRIDEPHSAASVIIPRILLPFTTAPSLWTSTLDLNLFATFTNSAPGRTCMPSGFTIWASRSIIAIPRRPRAPMPPDRATAGVH